MINYEKLYQSNQRTLKELAINQKLNGFFDYNDTFGLVYVGKSETNDPYMIKIFNLNSDIRNIRKIERDEP